MMLSLRQLTHGPYGHTLNRRQVLSPDRKWAVYDTRNDDSKIAQTSSIEMVHVDSGEIVPLYKTSRATEHGPGVGAVAFHPSENRICFIHGLDSCSAESPYSAARRFGAILETHPPGPVCHAESRWMQSSLAEGQNHWIQPSDQAQWIHGVLSGGTHAHSWNRHGWLSFTYNDAHLERWSKGIPNIRDARTVGFMMPHRIASSRLKLQQDASESFVGYFAAFLAVQLVTQSTPGSDEVEHALEECWLTSTQLAVQGALRDRSGKLFYDVFRIDLPNTDELSRRVGSRLDMGTEPSRRLIPVPDCHQTRLTRTDHRKFPGIQGPRNWLVGSFDGSQVYFPMRDDSGTVQLYRVRSLGGALEQVSELTASIESQISLDSEGKRCAFIASNRICVVDVESGSHHFYPTESTHALVGAVHFVDQERFLVNAYVGREPNRFLQIFVCG